MISGAPATLHRLPREDGRQSHGALQRYRKHKQRERDLRTRQGALFGRLEDVLMAAGWTPRSRLISPNARNHKIPKELTLAMGRNCILALIALQDVSANYTNLQLTHSMVLKRVMEWSDPKSLQAALNADSGKLKNNMIQLFDQMQENSSQYEDEAGTSQETSQDS